MKRSVRNISNYTINGTDGPLGYIDDFYFNRRKWIIRYFLIKEFDEGLKEIGEQQINRILSPPLPIDQIDFQREEILVPYSRKEIMSSPRVILSKPLPVKKELECFDHFKNLGFWDTKSLNDYPDTVLNQDNYSQFLSQGYNPNLLRCRTLLDFDVQTIDGELGSIKDFVIDDTNRRIDYFIVKSKGWIVSRDMLVDPFWIEEIVISDAEVHLNIPNSVATVSV